MMLMRGFPQAPHDAELREGPNVAAEEEVGSEVDEELRPLDREHKGRFGHPDQHYTEVNSGWLFEDLMFFAVGGSCGIDGTPDGHPRVTFGDGIGNSVKTESGRPGRPSSEVGRASACSTQSRRRGSGCRSWDGP